MKKLLGIVVLGLMCIFVWGISGCDAGKAQAKDNSIAHIKNKFTLDKDIADGQWKIPLQKGLKKYSVMTVSAGDGHPVRNGKKSIRFEVRPGDCAKSRSGSWDDCKKDRERVEIQSLKYMKKGEYWWAWSLYLPKDYQGVFPLILTLGQFHTDAESGHPYFMFYNNTWNKFGENTESGGGLHFENQMRVNYDNSYTGPSELFTEEQMLGKWNDIVVNVNFSHKDDGWFKIWANGKLVYEYRGATKVKKGKADFQFGIYRSFVSTWDGEGVIPSTIVYYDEIRYAEKHCKKLNLDNLGYSCKALESQSTEIHTYGTVKPKGGIIQIEGKYQLKWYWVNENTKTNNITKNKFVVFDMISFQKGITTFDKFGSSRMISNKYREKIEFYQGEGEEIIITGNLDLDSQQDTEAVTILLKPDPDSKGTYVGMGLWNHNEEKSKKEYIKAILVPIN